MRHVIKNGSDSYLLIVMHGQITADNFIVNFFDFEKQIVIRARRLM